MTTTQTKHTALPWLLMPDGLTISGNDPEGARYQEIAKMRDGNSVHPHLAVTTEEQQANAAFIVRACNSHEELVGALEMCIEYFEGVTEREVEPSSEAYLKARSALAKARGEG